MRDFADAGRIFDEFAVEKQNELSAEDRKVICDMFGGIDWD
jgi:hypothetical protein